MSEITRILVAIDSGDPKAAEALLPLVYDELRRVAAVQLAHERPGQTLDATGLVHEAYLRLVGDIVFNGKSHFFRAAAESMRRILIDAARQRRSLKRGGSRVRMELSESDPVTWSDPSTLLTINDVLEELAVDDPQSAELARLRLFAGVSVAEAGQMLGMSRATAFRNWQFARAVLSAALQDEAPSLDEEN